MLFTCYSRLKENIYRTSWNVKKKCVTKNDQNILWGNHGISRYGIDIFQNIIILPSLYMIDCPKTWHLKVQYVTFDPLVVK